ncbi:MAG: c-type cytochrome [Betaproteobacteria bacterium]
MGIALFASGASAQSSAVGRELFMDPAKGNCDACHAVGASLPAAKRKIGSDLSNIQSRYPDKTRLRADIWELGARMAETVMPAYGKNRILTETEIDALVNYVQTL